ncbi:MAG: hypothetical protein ACI82F_004617, partial [Planctomycetota bacterium]
GLSDGRSFSPKVVYVYEKQLEEADLILVNKCDDLAEAEREELAAKLAERFPRAEVLTCSALRGDGLAPWFERLMNDESSYGPTMELDYQVYAEGEALLGWLNATAQVQSTSSFDANALLTDLCEGLRGKLVERDLEIAHLKATLDTAEAGGMLAAVSMTSSDGSLDQREALLDAVSAGQLIVNLRAEADPELLNRLVSEELKTCAARHPGLTIELEHEEHFRPSPPTPTVRISSEEAVSLGKAVLLGKASASESTQ